MKRLILLLFGLFAAHLLAADTATLTLTKTIPLPDVRGRIDHFALDVQGQRLFMAALGNDTVEVIDLAAGKRIRTIADCSEPQGLGFVPTENRLVIANGSSGVVKILDATSFKVLHTIGNLPDADNVRCDAKAGLVYVGYGDGALAVIDPKNSTKLTDIPLSAHPESFQLEGSGSRIFVNVPGAEQIAVIDREKKAVVATWPMKEFRANFPMALDEVDHRMFIGCRRSARLVILDTTTGKKVSDLEIGGDTDDVFYNAKRKLIYVSCGGGSIDVIAQQNADVYQLRERIATPSGARTSYFSQELGELFLAVRAGMFSGSAEIQIFRLGK